MPSLRVMLKSGIRSGVHSGSGWQCLDLETAVLCLDREQGQVGSFRLHSARDDERAGVAELFGAPEVLWLLYFHLLMR